VILVVGPGPIGYNIGLRPAEPGRDVSGRGLPDVSVRDAGQAAASSQTARTVLTAGAPA
jgi:hypothetical protein